MTKKVNGGVYFISLQTSSRNSNETCSQGRLSPLLIVSLSEGIRQTCRYRIKTQTNSHQGTFNGVTGVAPVPVISDAQEEQIGRVAPTSSKLRPFC